MRDCIREDLQSRVIMLESELHDARNRITQLQLEKDLMKRESELEKPIRPMNGVL